MLWFLSEALNFSFLLFNHDLFIYCFYHMDNLSACMYMHCVHVWCLLKSEEGVGSLEIGITDGCELLCGCWELNLGSLECKPMLLTSEPSL